MKLMFLSSLAIYCEILCPNVWQGATLLLPDLIASFLDEKFAIMLFNLTLNYNHKLNISNVLTYNL